MSSPIGQEAVFGVYQNSDRFKVKVSSLGDWYDVRTVNIATLFLTSVLFMDIYFRYIKTCNTFALHFKY